MSIKNPKFSIIICLHKITNRFYNDLKKYEELTFRDFEVVLVTEKNAKLENNKLQGINLSIRVIKAKKEKISLGDKRDIGYISARGEFCAYIDDDAYPDKNWLTNALKTLNKESNIGVLGGPNITPKEDNFWARIGGHIYESYLTSAGAQYRFVPMKKGIVRELQGVNMIIPKKELVKLGGFDCELNSGDDDKICSDFRKNGYKIMYDPEIIVYHHRREFPIAHLKQVKSMGTHRGFFLKAFPKTFGPIYFFPPAMVIGLFLFVLISVFYVKARLILLALLFIYFILCYISSVKRADISSSFVVAIGIMLTHFIYGMFFIKGLMSRKVV